MKEAEPPIARVNFYSGETLEAGDFQAEQNYFLRLRREGNRGFYGAGITRGLEVTQVGSSLLAISSGAAIDNQGREIVLPKAQKLSIPAGLTGLQFLTITYSEFETQFTQSLNNEGTILFSGFKRTAEQALFTFTQQAALTPSRVVLALVDITTTGRLRAIDDGNDENRRHHCGLEVGRVHFSGAVPLARPELFTEIQDKHQRLTFRASNTQITGTGQVNGKAGVNTETPTARLTVQGRDLSSRGTGRLSHDPKLDGRQIRGEGTRFTAEVEPDDWLIIEPGTVVIPVFQVHSDISLTAGAPAGSSLAGSAYQIVKPAVPLAETIAQFHDPLGNPVFKLTEDGAGLGPYQKGHNRFTVNISATGHVGVGVGNDSEIITPRLEIAGDITATNFVGNGAQLTNLPSRWSRPKDNRFIYYNKGAVGIGTAFPHASLHVIGGAASPGKGFVSMDPGGQYKSPKHTIKGIGSQFQSQVGPGDILAVDDLCFTIASVAKQGQILTTLTPIDVKLTKKCYTIAKPIVRFGSNAGLPVQGIGNISSVAKKVTGQGTDFLAQLAPGDTIEITQGGQSLRRKVAEVKTVNHLELEEKFPKNLHHAAYLISLSPAHQAPILTVLADNKVGINTAAPTHALEVHGTLNPRSHVIQTFGGMVGSAGTISELTTDTMVVNDFAAVGPLDKPTIGMKSENRVLTCVSMAFQPGGTLSEGIRCQTLQCSEVGVTDKFTLQTASHSLGGSISPTSLLTIDAFGIHGSLNMDAALQCGTLAVTQSTSLMAGYISKTEGFFSLTDGFLTGYYQGVIEVGARSWNLGNPWMVSGFSLFGFRLRDTRGTKPTQFLLPVPKDTTVSFGPPSGEMKIYWIPLGRADS